MRYFNKVKVNDEVFSLVYGKGVVTMALAKKHRVDGFYIFAVSYNDKKVVHYTVDGFPNWCSSDGCVVCVGVMLVRKVICVHVCLRNKDLECMSTCSVLFPLILDFKRARNEPRCECKPVL